MANRYDDTDTDDDPDSDDMSTSLEHHCCTHCPIKFLLEEKKSRKKNRKKRQRRFARQNILPVRPLNRQPRTAHEEELNQNGVVNVRSAFQGDIIITRLRNPGSSNDDDVDIYTLFSNLRARIKALFMEFYSRRGAFR